MESLTTGTLAGTGSFRCEGCGYVVTLSAADELPDCPGCGGARFARASLFSGGRFQRRTGDEPTAEEREALDRRGARARSRSPASTWPGTTAAACGSSSLEREWTRVGRSLAADVRFDDPTVSRRHALIVRQPDGVRVLDDRSLNGVFVNGERVEWRVARPTATRSSSGATACTSSRRRPPRRPPRGRPAGGRPADRGFGPKARGGEGRRGPGCGIRALSARA